MHKLIQNIAIYNMNAYFRNQLLKSTAQLESRQGTELGCVKVKLENWLMFTQI
jgi:hypothetical protein